MDAAIDAILTSNPALWRPGRVYTFEIAPNQLPPSSPTEREAKIGFSGMPPRRKREWMRQCRPQQQEWRFYYHVPDARRFEALIHLHFRLHSAWIPPKRCEFCGVRHQEKFSLARCGEMDGIIAVFDTYLHHVDVGWEDRESARAELDGAAFEDLDALPRATHAEAPVIPRSVVHALLAEETPMQF
ncbi:hypothetical protein B0H17DRAFT_1211590 [Mycena rosella]|uniref:Bacteriophage T5 Orf172 DNA-binding domain-containing protein n=1 Tax=Mycena rosella TaxID=1033263 RepID=A0AAD7G7K9_MYCRO|nr:hypothetical protein B0H17DRAFT_1211590 [Mycena rosella]